MDFDQWIVRWINIFSFHLSRLFSISLHAFHSISLMQPIEVCVVFISFIHKQSTYMCIRFRVSSFEFVYIVYALQSTQINVFLRLILLECLFSSHTNHKKPSANRKKQKRMKHFNKKRNNWTRKPLRQIRVVLFYEWKT